MRAAATPTLTPSYAPADTDGVLQACSAFDLQTTDVKASLVRRQLTRPSDRSALQLHRHRIDHQAGRAGAHALAADLTL